jgi:hypothetical protein
VKRFWRTRLFALSLLLGILGPLAVSGPAATAADDAHFRAGLDAFQEIPSKLTGGHGTFRAALSGGALSYELTYAGLSTPAVVAHIHFAQRGVNGGIFAFLCGGGGKPACPPAGGTVTGTIAAADILAPAPDQGLAAGDFAGALRALRSGNTYANVHSTRFPAGEIRGQIRTEGQAGDD